MNKKLMESKPIDGLKDATHIDVEVYYTKGGANYFSGGTIPRGYYLSVTPVTRKNNMVSFTMFRGAKKLLLETNRYSDKQLDKAVEMSKEYVPELMQRVLKKEQAA